MEQVVRKVACTIDKETLMKLMKRSMMYRLMTSVNEEIKQLNERANKKITHKDISIMTGRAENWFNKSFTNYQDMTLSTFIRVVGVIQESAKEVGINLSQTDFFSRVFNDEILLYGQIINDLTNEEPQYLAVIINEKQEVFRDLTQYWGIMAHKNKLSPQELHVLKSISELLNLNTMEDK